MALPPPIARGGPILSPDQPYDAGGINEPSVLYWRDQWWLWYVGMPATQTSEQRIMTCVATCPGQADPLLPRSWIKRGPVLPAPSMEPNVIPLPDGSLRMFHSDHQSCRVSDSSDGLHWKPRGVALPVGTAGRDWWADCTVWREGNHWRGLFEGGWQTGPWQIFHGTSSDGISFTLSRDQPLASLALGTGMYGGPYLPIPGRIGGLYHCWYHASRDGDRTIDVYHAVSQDGMIWRPDPTPVVSHGPDCAIADNPSVLAVRGATYLFWGGGEGHGGINVARLAGDCAHRIMT